MTAREEILNKIRIAIPAYQSPDIEWQAIPRPYRRSSTLEGDGLMHLLEDRLHDYDATVKRCTRADLPRTIAETLAARNKTRMAIPEGVPAAWLPEAVAFTQDLRDNVTLLDTAEGVLTTSTVSIALTGTIILQDVLGQGRRAASLVPDYHLCIVPFGSIVETVPEALARLQPTATLATTFFSGPSATADIEMTRIKGVHGPRFVDVLLLLD